MDILEILRNDHDEIEALIGQLDALLETADVTASEQAFALTEQLAFCVRLHAQVEARSFYDRCRAASIALEDFALEGDKEHEVIEHMLRRLESCHPGSDGRMRAALTAIRNLVEHHARNEEEGRAFLLARRVFSSTELVALGQTMLAEKEALRRRMQAALDRLRPERRDGHRHH